MSNTGLPQLGSTLPPVVDLPPPPGQQSKQQSSAGPKTITSTITEGVDLGAYVKAFIYGDTGAGKTVFGATAPAPLFLDTENSTEILRDWPELLAQCKILHVEWDNIHEAVERIKSDKYKDRQTLILDTADALQRNNLSEHVMASEQNSDPFLPMQHHYKKSGEMLVRLLIELRRLPMHVLILSHMKEVMKEDGSVRYIRPGISPKVQDAVKQEYSLFGFLYQSENDYRKPFQNRLQTRPDRVVQGKCRYRHLLPIIENPTFQSLIDAARKFKETAV